MMPNPYAPPIAEVADIPRGDSSQLPFFAVSVFKLAVLSICTLGLYEIYWFYRHWKAVKLREDDSVWPVPRAIFAVVFCYPFFKRVRSSELELGIEPTLAAGLLATGWIVATIMYKLPFPYGLVSYFAALFLLPVQAHANRVNEARAPLHDRNSHFTAWNWVVIVLGSILLVLGLVGTFMPRHANGV